MAKLNHRESIIPRTQEAGDAPSEEIPPQWHAFVNAEQLAGAVAENAEEVLDTFRVFSVKYHEILAAHNEMVKRVAELHNEVQDKKAEIVEQKLTIARVEGIVDYQDDQLKRLRERLQELQRRTGSPELGVPETPPLPPATAPPVAPVAPVAPVVPVATSASPSLLPTPTVASMAEKQRKSAKFPDPPILTTGTDPIFVHWRLQMRSKLEANSDHFPTEALRMAYVENRTAGAALGHLEPRRRLDALHPFVTAAEMFAALEAVYGDPNRQRTARTKYKLLKQGDKDFNVFWGEFQRLAADLEHNEATLIDDLFDKAHHTIQRQLVTGEAPPTSLRDLALRCQRIAQGLKDVDRNKAASERQAERKSSNSGGNAKPSAPATTASASGPASVSSRIAARGSARSESRLSEEDKERLRKEDRCYKCKEVGYHRPCTKEWQPMPPAGVVAAVEEVEAGKE